METPLQGTFKFPIDVPLPPYDPWELPYGKAPEGVYARIVDRSFPLIDFREKVLCGNYSTARSREYLRTHGFTAVKHRSVLHSSPYGHTADFQNVELVDEIYYPEVEQLIKHVTGCSYVFVTDSVIRGPPNDNETLSDSSWKMSTNARKANASGTVPQSNHMHKAEPSPPTRLPHWDFTPLGARQTVRKWSKDIVDHAKHSRVIYEEDETCGKTSATEVESESAIQEGYHGPRYAAYSVWRPLKKVTRDPLAMAPFDQTGLKDYVVVSHKIKQPGIDEPWLRDLATLKVTQSAAKTLKYSPELLKWHYISDQDVDEVLVVKAFDSAALKGQAEMTGEAQGVPHASPDLGNSGYGQPRESIEVRVFAFW